MSQVEESAADRILDAAVALFARKGFSATSTREIITAAGVTQPTLYYHFGSKEGLCRAALTRFTDAIHGRLRRVVEHGDASDPRRFLADMAWAFLEHLDTHRDLSRLMRSLYFGPEHEAALFDFARHTSEGTEIFLAGIAKANAGGLMPKEREREFMVALKGIILMVQLSSQEQLPGCPMAGVAPTREIAQRVVDMLLDGFLPRG